MMINKLKKNTLLQGLVSLYRQFFKSYRKRMAYCADDAHVAAPRHIVGHANIRMEENTGIGPNSTILTPYAKFIIKKNSGCAPGLFVATGNHERRIGRFYRTITDKDKSTDIDRDVIIEEDCWLGGNVALLSGVTIKRGTTVANGAVVAKDTVPYSVWGGVPARFIKFYWTIDQIMEHEAQLYSPEERYSKTELEEIFAKYQ